MQVNRYDPWRCEKFFKEDDLQTYKRNKFSPRSVRWIISSPFSPPLGNFEWMANERKKKKKKEKGEGCTMSQSQRQKSYRACKRGN